MNEIKYTPSCLLSSSSSQRRQLDNRPALVNIDRERDESLQTRSISKDDDEEKTLEKVFFYFLRCPFSLI